MTQPVCVRPLLAACAFLAAFATADVNDGREAFSGVSLIGQAEAKVVIRRSTVYVNTLPRGCVRSRVGGVVVRRCGKTYYQPYNGRYVVVYIN